MFFEDNNNNNSSSTGSTAYNGHLHPLGVSPLAHSSPYNPANPGVAPASPAPNHALDVKQNVYVPRSVRSKTSSSSTPGSEASAPEYPSRHQSRHDQRDPGAPSHVNLIRASSTPPTAYRREPLATPSSPYRSSPISPNLASPAIRRDPGELTTNSLTRSSRSAASSNPGESPGTRRRLLSNG